MNHGSPPTSSRWAGVTAVATLAALASAFALARAGFVGISDDDAARTLIAWDFARAPSLDPTRSSWLPVHTYLLGSALAATRELWITPRVVSLLGAIASAAAVVHLARRLGCSPRWAAFGALTALLFPWSVFSAWAPGVPEMPCCALFLSGCALVTGRHGPPTPARALLAGVFVSLACGHRYEAWFAGAGLIVGALWAWQCRRAVIALGVGTLLVPAAWLAVNYARSGHPLNFVTRVVDYRQAYETFAPVAARLIRYPHVLFVHGGVLVGAALYGIRKRTRTAGPLLSSSIALLLWLIVTEITGGGATHHVARSILLIIWLLAPVAAVSLNEAFQKGGSTRLLALTAATLSTVQLAAGLREMPREVSPNAVTAGRTLRQVLHSGERYFIEMARFDALWIMLASGMPERAVPDRPAPRRFTAAIALDPNQARECAVAVVSEGHAEKAFVRAGWQRLATYGPWTVLSAPQ